MKKLLLTSAIVAVAGAAAAEVTWSGDATVGYRTHDDDGLANFDNANGLFTSANVTATGTAELDGGITASISYGFDLDYKVERANDLDDIEEGDDGWLPNYGDDVVGLDNFPTIKLESSVGTMTVGDVDHAAHELFKAAGPDDVIFLGELADLDQGLKDVENPVGFTEQDAEMVGRVDTTLSTFTVGVSYVVADGYSVNTQTGAEKRWDDVALPMGSYTIGANGALAGFEMSLGYEYNDDTMTSKYGVSTGYTWNGITGRIGYQAAEYQNYMVGEDDRGEASFSKIGLTGDYEMSNGIKLGAGLGFLNGTVGDEDYYTDADGNGTTVITYDVHAGFKAMGADITAGYKGSNWDVDLSGFEDYATTGAFYADASYAIEGTGVTILAGYDGSSSIVLSDDDNFGKLGAYYVGTTYDLGGGASIFATYSNGDEVGAPDYQPGGRFGVKMTF